MRRILVASLTSLLLTSTGTLAAEQNGSATAGASVSTAAVVLAPRPDVGADLTLAPQAFEARRPMILPALYGASAFLQGYDAYSTLSVLNRGGVEVNPVMKGITKSPAAFIGLKTGVTMLSIMAAERMWKSRNRVGAVATMIISSGLMTVVAANNARVLSRLK